MTRRQMAVIARRAALLAKDYLGEENRQVFDYQDYYKEYMDQLQTGDDDCLKNWIGSQIEAGVREAVEIRKLWLKSQLAGA